MAEKPPIPPKVSAYLTAGSPKTCFLPACHLPIIDMCVHGRDGHFYCSRICAETGASSNLSRVRGAECKALRTCRWD